MGHRISVGREGADLAVTRFGGASRETFVHVPCAPTEPVVTVFSNMVSPLPRLQKPAMRTSTGVIGLLPKS